MSSNRALGSMLVSKAKNRTIQVDVDKVSLGSFYTTRSGWLTPQVINFLESALNDSKGLLLDPFAGDGHLLDAISRNEILKNKVVKAEGFDIQGKTWPINDSLIEIPNPRRAVIVTNPPYLANHSAKRKGVATLVTKYFERSTQKNLYMIALENCLESSDYVVAIIPETFLLSSFPKDRLELVVVIQTELFGDTDAPALVACFTKNACDDAQVLLGSKPIGSLSGILALRELEAPKRKVVFNDSRGRIGLRAVDGSDGNTPIAFFGAKDFEYPRDSVVNSSRLMTYLEMPELNNLEVSKVIGRANSILGQMRLDSGDLVLAPFKGNDRTGKRRRRLDYALARRILNLATKHTQ
jgi:hypothetical protein